MLSTPPAAALGHMDKERENLHSTKTVNNNQDFPPTDGPGKKTYKYASKIITFTQEMKTYLDLSGCFPYKLSQGSEYIYII
eukprot:504144-Ditylum_brightwellii.AAC.1